MPIRIYRLQQMPSLNLLAFKRDIQIAVSYELPPPHPDAVSFHVHEVQKREHKEARRNDTVKITFLSERHKR